MSRQDSGKSPRITTPGRPGPRKLPLYSPSELSPFSFNEDSLKIFDADIEQQNGLIPLNISYRGAGSSGGGGKCFSQPQTPSEERRSIFQEPIVTRRPPSSPLNVASSLPHHQQYPQYHPPPQGGLTQSRSFSGQTLSHSVGASVGASGAGTPGKTMRDYDESFKEMKKENFNLKMRIFFLEERLGLGKKTTSEELANTNLELKIQVENYKQDLAEKSSLLAEASVAIEDLEKQLESQKQLIKKYQEDQNTSKTDVKFELGGIPKSRNIVPRSPDVFRKPLMSPKFHHKNYFFPQDENKNNSSSNILEILKEDEEVQPSPPKCQCSEYQKKIRGLEESLKISREAQNQLSECLQKSKTVSLVETSPYVPDTMSHVTPDMTTPPDTLSAECSNLKSENRKIRDQLKLQVQERKLLLKKISMLKEQLGSVSETEHKTLPSRDFIRCADIGTQCMLDIENNNVNIRDCSVNTEPDEDMLDNPLSDTSTWNTELPNIADIQLCSSTELVFDCENPEISQMEHLTSQLESYRRQISAKLENIEVLEQNIAAKDITINDQSRTIKQLKSEMSRVTCPVLDLRQRHVLRRRRTRVRDRPVHVYRDRDSPDSDQWSEPEPGVSLTRIGLPESYPEMSQDCDHTSLLSDDDNYRHHGIKCNSNKCFLSGTRELETLLSTLLHQVDVLQNLDSGIDTSDNEDDNDESHHNLLDNSLFDASLFTLCDNCASNVPEEFGNLIKRTYVGLSSAIFQIENIRTKMLEVLNKNKQLKSKEKEEFVKSEEAKLRLNENYILIAKLSTENLRLLGDYSKLETQHEDLKKKSVEIELRLQDEICAFNSKIFEKDRETEKLHRKVTDLNDRLHQLQDSSSLNKWSPDTSSSFDYFPPNSGSSLNDGYRPRAFSAVSSSPKSYKGKLQPPGKDPKLMEVSSPDLGVESDLYSSLERGNTSKVGSLAFEKIVQENRSLRHEREILNQKLGRSKSALQETLLRLSKSNLQKQDQMISPSLQRRGLPSRGSQNNLEM